MAVALSPATLEWGTSDHARGLNGTATYRVTSHEYFSIEPKQHIRAAMHNPKGFIIIQVEHNVCTLREPHLSTK
jgi:hypothetical protein